jgi:diacylglycerol kinase (ATP)
MNPANISGYNAPKENKPTMPDKIKLILNPTANHGRSVQEAADLRMLLAKYHTDWSGTEYPGQAIEFARQAGEEGCDLVVSLGGDGTVHEVVNGLMQVPQDKRPALGIIPLGSGNDFAHILGIPAAPGEALLSAINGQPHSMDVGSVCDEEGRQEFFNNTLGMGFDAAVNEHTRKITAIHGFPMYFLALMRTIFRNFDALDLHIETDQESMDISTLMLGFGNGPREGGGFIITPDAKWDDGILNYITVQKISRLMMLRLVPEFMRGTQGRFKVVRLGTCRSASVTSRQPMCVHCDGEIYAGFGTNVRKLEIRLIPNAIRFMKA